MIPAIEQASIADIEELQISKLKDLLIYLKNCSPYYQRIFQELNVDITSIQHLRDLQRLPCTRKDDLQRFNKDFFCVPMHQIVDYATTSGTLGEPITFGLTDADLDRLAYNEMISFQCAGIKKGDIVQLMCTMDRRFMAGLAYFLGLRKLGAGTIRIGAGVSQLQWDSILQYKPKYLIAVPSFLLKMIAYAEQNGIDYRASSVEAVICIGESLRTASLSASHLAQRIQEKWPIKLISTYASTEMSAAFTECEAMQGGHQHPELIITEVLDENEQAVADGELGELVVTTLGIEALPLLRYKTGDMVRRFSVPCSCGRNTYRIGPVEGRKQQMIKYKGTSLYPPAIHDLLASFEEINLYVIEISNTEVGTDDILIQVASTTPTEELLARIKDTFRAKLRVTPTLVFQQEEILQRTVFNPLSRKPINFIDHRI